MKQVVNIFFKFLWKREIKTGGKSTISETLLQKEFHLIMVEGGGVARGYKICGLDLTSPQFSTAPLLITYETYLISRSLKIQMYPALMIGSSGSKCLKMYILVFSIIAKRSGLSTAHFMSQTSFRSKRINSPSRPAPECIWDSSKPPPWLPSRSRNWRRPVTSMIDKHLKSDQ